MIQQKRSIVRLGEHDRSTTEDGEHLDISVDRVDAHDSFNSRLMTNDIAMIYLERDVEFTGKLLLSFLHFTIFFET